MLPVSNSACNERVSHGASPADPPAAAPDQREKSTRPHEKVRTRRVLVVDDELLIRWSLGEVLLKAGYEVLEAGDARAALQHLEAAPLPVDAILLDLRLPDSADLGLLARIRQILPDVPVIMMTAYGTPETTEEALRLGARQVVIKPFDLNRVVGLISTVVS